MLFKEATGKDFQFHHCVETLMGCPKFANHVDASFEEHKTPEMEVRNRKFTGGLEISTKGRKKAKLEKRNMDEYARQQEENRKQLDRLLDSMQRDYEDLREARAERQAFRKKCLRDREVKTSMFKQYMRLIASKLYGSNSEETKELFESMQTDTVKIV